MVALLLLWPMKGTAQDDEVTFPLDNFYAKIKKSPRSIFRNFRFSFSTGYGNTFMSHQLEGFGVYQPAGGGYPAIFLNSATPGTMYSNWVNNIAIDKRTIKPGSFYATSDTTKLGFKGSAMNIPLQVSLHYEFKGKYRIGGGYSYEYMSIGAMHPTHYTDKISSFQVPAPSGWMSKYYAIFGASFYRLGNYLFTGDLQVGGFSPGANFNPAVVTPGMYFNFGVTIERELSEYLRLFVRPSYDLKSYTLALPEGGISLTHHMNALYLNVGFSYSIPELPKCKIPGCRIQINHAHGDREYRSNVHPIYKKQNPQYGENHPNLIKYKGKNKRKLNPY